ncbi:MAG: nucleotidyltransferase domain-containing protein [Alphaproteobacteria bacterium]|nr:nucleotidyltransferase domain-containing protein [Alphaproteobacteria bacterium]
MSEAALSDPILARIKSELEALYGARLKRVLLYGSRARGDHHEDSDYDILVVLEGPLDRWPDKKLPTLSNKILWETIGEGKPVDVSFKAMTEEQTRERTGFMHNVRQDAIEL